LGAFKEGLCFFWMGFNKRVQAGLQAERAKKCPLRDRAGDREPGAGGKFCEPAEVNING